jgi:PAS domain S-box-containing protein
LRILSKSNCVTRVLLVCSVVVWAGWASAQPQVRPIHDQPWQTVSLLEDAGFESVYIFGIDFAPDGIAWLATNIGLYRYDGYSWQHFTTQNGLPSDFVRSVLITRAGELWIGTSHGAGVFDGKRFDPRGADKGLAGPSVRRIVEDPDGTLWFCSDRWPDPSVDGGLATLSHGVWRRFGKADGIQQEYVHNYFRDSHGRQFAMTIGGILERIGDRWEPLREPGFPVDARPGWQMAELPDGDLLLQETDRVVARHDGRWIAFSHPREPMLVTRAGELIGIAEDSARQTLAFQRWTGPAAGFVTASAETDVQDAPAEMTREAPDGSIWCVGKGILLRWRYSAPTWTALSGLPAPQGVDAGGRAWFADATSVWIAHDGTYEQVTDARGPIRMTDTGEVWTTAPNGFLRLQGSERQSVTQATAGLATLRTVMSDAHGLRWLVGYTPDGQPALRSFDGTTWRTPTPAIPEGYDVTMMERDPTEGMWLTLRQRTTGRWVVARLHAGALSILSAAHLPPLQAPRLAVRRDGICLYDYTDAYLATDSSLESWRRLDLPLDRAGTHFTLADVTWFTFSGSRPGRRGVAAFRDGRWGSVPVDWRGNVMSGPSETLLLPAIHGFFIVGNDPGTTAPEFVGVPGTAAITRVIEDAQRVFWIATNTYVLRYRPDPTPLRAAVASAVSEVRSDRELQVTLSARRRYEPRSEADRFEYSWRVDNAAWTPFQPGESVRLAPGFAGIGAHRVQVRARDAHGATSAQMAELRVMLLAVPLQERAWFWPFIGAIGALLVYTTGAAWSARARLARQARGLEQKVRERTEQLERDIVHRKRAEAALRESEQRFKGVFNSAFQLICVLSPDGLVQETNQTALDAIGQRREDVIGRPFWETPWWNHSTMLQEQLRDAVSRATRGEILQFETEHPRGNGVPMTVDCSIKAVRDEAGQVSFVIAEGRDITERKQSERDRSRLETQLRQAQKIEAIGTLAGGIAHDFNNLLTSIFGNAEVAALEVPKDHPVQDRLVELLQAAHRARDLVNQILIFSRRQEQERRPLQLGPIISEALKLMRASLPRTVEITAQIPLESASVLADPVQIHQVVMNLCTNAAHAMREMGGKLTVSLVPVDVDADFARLHPKLQVGPYLRLAVSDTGHGIEAETLDRIFEPFFSTKPPGEGTGLGLSVVHGIMANHDGAVTVYSQVGYGTTFHLYFPAVDAAVRAAPLAAAGIIRGAGERVLVVDDEVSVAEVAVRMLERAGYEARSYTDPVEALEVFEQDPDQFALVLTDLTMPKLTGIELAHQLRRIRPDLPIVLGSGFSDHIGEQRARQAGVRELLLKPYTMRDLAEAVHRVLTGVTSPQN